MCSASVSTLNAIYHNQSVIQKQTILPRKEVVFIFNNRIISVWGKWPSCGMMLLIRQYSWSWIQHSLATHNSTKILYIAQKWFKIDPTWNPVCVCLSNYFVITTFDWWLTDANSNNQAIAIIAYHENLHSHIYCFWFPFLLQTQLWQLTGRCM